VYTTVPVRHHKGTMPQSTNFFAALDDSDDEAGTPQMTKRQPVSITASSTRGTTTATDAKKNDRRSGNHNNEHRNNNNKGSRVRPAARDGKRTFDRRSGTGRGKEIKKGGGGARNWGSDKVDARSGEGALDENRSQNRNRRFLQGHSMSIMKIGRMSLRIYLSFRPRRSM